MHDNNNNDTRKNALLWRYKKDGKWTWKPAKGLTDEQKWALSPLDALFDVYKEEEE